MSLAAVMIPALLLSGACTERDTDPNESGDAVLWTYGDADRIVLSDPVEDLDHNIFVIVGDVGDCNGCTHPPVGVAVDRVLLVSLSPSGEERWSTEISGESPVHPYVDPAPAVLASGEATVCLGSDVVRVSNTGAIAWRRDEGCGTAQDDCWDPGHAVAVDGAYAVLRRVPGGVPEYEKARATEVVVYDRDGDVLWSRTVGLPSICRGELISDYPGTFIDGLAFDAAGAVVVGCDTCAAGPAVVRLDPKSGALLEVAEIPPEFADLNLEHMPFAHYSAPALENGNAWLSTMFLSRTLWRIEGGVAMEVPGRSGPLAAGGIVQRDHATEDALRILWGDDAVVLDPAEAAASPELTHAQPVAIVADDRLALLYDRFGNSGTRCGSQCGLYVMRRNGTIAWRSPDESVGLPLVTEGAIAYVTTERRLVVREAPVDGLAVGSWPSLLGDAQGSFREGK